MKEGRKRNGHFLHFSHCSSNPLKMEVEEAEVKSSVIVPSVVAAVSTQDSSEPNAEKKEEKKEERKKQVLVVEREKVLQE